MYKQCKHVYNVELYFITGTLFQQDGMSKISEKSDTTEIILNSWNLWVLY